MAAFGEDGLRPGDIVGGRYRIVGPIGSGGMGTVYRAEHVRVGQSVALKVLATHLLEHPLLVTRFEREARASGLLRSLHAVRIHDVDQLPNGVPYLVMEHLEGNDLQTETLRRDVPLPQLVAWVVQASSALAEAHANGIIHRDLKPANIFLAYLEHTRIAKVLDFGISTFAGDGQKLTADGLTVGTPTYMAPEQLRAAPDLDGRADVYALGVVLYKVLARRLPLESNEVFGFATGHAPPPPGLDVHRPDLPSAFTALVARALSRERAERPTMQELADSLKPFALARGVPQLRRDSTTQVTSPPRSITDPPSQGPPTTREPLAENTEPSLASFDTPKDQPALPSLVDDDTTPSTGSPDSTKKMQRP